MRLKPVPTILLVDDDEKDCAEIRRLLGSSGYDVIEAENWLAIAFGAFDPQPDLLLVSLRAPLTDKLTTARQILKNAQLGELPVVLIAKAGDAQQDPPELGIRNNEYVTWVADYGQLGRLLDYLLPTNSIAV